MFDALEVIVEDGFLGLEPVRLLVFIFVVHSDVVLLLIHVLFELVLFADLVIEVFLVVVLHQVLVIVHQVDVLWLLATVAAVRCHVVLF